MRWTTILQIFTLVFYFSDATVIERNGFSVRPREKVQSLGTTFIFCYISSHFAATDVEYLSVLVSNQDPVQSAQITITSIFPTFTNFTVTVPPNNVTRIDINPPNLQSQYPNTQTGVYSIEDKGLQLVSSIPVSVVTDNEHYLGYSSDSLTVLPVCMLGTRYETFNDQTVVYATNSMYSIVATQDNTLVSVFAFGQWYNNTINRLQVLTFSHIVVITGQEIFADKPVAVISGTVCGIGTQNHNICDHQAEMLLPAHAWGTRFAFISFAGSMYNEFVLTVDQVTSVYNGDTLLFTLQPNQYLIFNYSNAYIWADKPCEAVQVGKRTEGTVQHGAPFFINVPAVEQYMSGSVLFTTNANRANNTAHYVHMVTTLDWVGTLALDGYTPSPLLYTRVGRSNLYFNRQRITEGQHWIVPATSATKYVAMVYGMGDSTGYGFVAGYDMPENNGACSTNKWQSLLARYQ